MTVEQQRHHLEQIQREKEQREHADRVRQQSEQARQAPISQAPISTSKGSKLLFPVITANKIKITTHASHFSKWGERQFHSINAGSTQASRNQKGK